MKKWIITALLASSGLAMARGSSISPPGAPMDDKKELDQLADDVKRFEDAVEVGVLYV